MHAQMTRRDFLAGLFRFTMATTLSTRLSLATASGLEKKLLWEEAQRLIEQVHTMDLVTFANYAPPRNGLPAVYTVTLCEQQNFMGYPEGGRLVLYPLRAQHFAALPPGYKGEQGEDPRFSKGTPPALPAGPTFTLPQSKGEPIVYPLQPLPNPYYDWDGIFLRKGTYEGEEYTFVVGRHSFPTFIVEKRDAEVRLTFYDFSSVETFEGVFGVYRNGRLDDLLAFTDSPRKNAEYIRVKPIVLADLQHNPFKGVYPLKFNTSSIHRIEVRIPLARKNERITFIYDSRGTITLPPAERDVHGLGAYMLGSSDIACLAIPLRLSITSSLLPEKVRVTPKTTTYLSRSHEGNEAVALDLWLENALETFNLKRKPGITSHIAIAYPKPTVEKGVSVSAIPERLPAEEY